MTTDRRFSALFLQALPVLALGLAGPRPLHDLPGREVLGAVLLLGALAALWRVAGAALARGDAAQRLTALAGALLLAPWMLIAATWIGFGPPFQATLAENNQRFLLLVVNALLVGIGFVVLRESLVARGERVLTGVLLGTTIFATGLYVTCTAITLANTTQALQGDRTPLPAIVSHLYDVLEFFACVLTYASTALAATALGRVGLLGKTCVRVVVILCALCLVLLVLRGVEYPEISGHTAPWYTQPGVIVRIPAIPWLIPGLLAATLLRRANRPA